MRYASRFIVLAALLAMLVPMPLCAQAQETDLWSPSLQVDPSPAPDPILRYRFRVNGDQEIDENAARHYREAIHALPRLTRDEANRFESIFHNGTPLSEIDLPEAEQTLRAAWGDSRASIERAVLCARCSWDQDDLESTLGPMRAIAKRIAAEATVAMLRPDNTEKTAAWIGAGFTLATDLQESDSFLANLTGVAIAALMTNTIETWIQQPHAPNLYWALSEIPDDEFALRRGIAGDIANVDRLLPALSDLESLADDESGEFDADRWSIVYAETEQRWTRAFDDMMAFYGSDDAGDDTTSTVRWMLAYECAVRHADSLAHLRSQGIDDEASKDWPVVYVSLRSELTRYTDIRDVVLSALNDPPRTGARRINDLDLRTIPPRDEAGMTTPFGYITDSLSTYRGALNSDLQVRMLIARLRVIEALRLHAHRHGELPGTLSDVNVVSIPDDPMTGRPFAYEIDANREVLITSQRPDPDGRIFECRVRLRK